MTTARNFIAVDLGATSGRLILGSVGEGRLELQELSRFPNKIITANGHYYWDFLGLYQAILEGLHLAAERQIAITSIGIDTWGVDFVCFAPNGELLGNPYSYRDPHTAGAQESFFRIVPRDEVYRTTGIQFMNFNSLFQLHAMRAHHSAALAAAAKVLFMPDAFSYMLTGEMAAEYTIASTSQLLDARSKTFDRTLLEALGMDESRFGRMLLPGEVIGTLTAAVQKQTGLGPVPVIAVAGHDTAAAVAAVPASDAHFAYLSSGTWSLMGIESPAPIIDEESFALNFTNEGGIDGTIRFLKNICGLWLLERCRAQWGGDADANAYPRLVAEAEAAPPFAASIDPDDAGFANPPDMVAAIRHFCERTGQPAPQSRGEITRTIFESLALRYRQVFESLRHLAGFPITRLHVIGGGSQNALLNQFTANALGIPVVAGPSEATAIGNIMVQARSAGLFPDRQAMRACIRAAVAVQNYQPEQQQDWTRSYERYLKVITQSTRNGESRHESTH
ncbi:MAG TPA: rhamnulokinase family protein [bacterium]|nr:rhamnulokinase family protein [bacterium]HPR87940.1 rhamnulokinase family protein [bacterium]